MNLDAARLKLTTDIKEFVGDKKAIIGLSGGIDSTVIAYLCVNALGADKVLGLTLPYGDGEDVHTFDGELVANELKIECKRINIQPMVDTFPKPDVNCKDPALVMGNVAARVRMIVLYQFANEFNGMVMGTTNKTEAAIGYYTKYGDGAVDVEPIADLYKTEVWELGKMLAVPDQIICKAPTANLWEAQTDEGELGMTYVQMDDILQAFEPNVVDGLDTVFKVVEKHGVEAVKEVQRRIAQSEHKRHMPPSFKLR